MKRQKNKLMTFIFSIIPGAGHMYLGLMKQGMSLMFLFCGLIFLARVTGIAPILYFLPLIWFYSFFDIQNKNIMSEEAFNRMEDKYMFFEELPDVKELLKGNNLLVFAILLFFIAGVLLLNTLSYFLNFVMGGSPRMVQFFMNKIPVIVVAAAAIWAGFELIQLRKASHTKAVPTVEVLPKTEEDIADAEYHVVEEDEAEKNVAATTENPVQQEKSES